MRLLVVGGSDAGISAGLRARELDPSVEAALGLDGVHLLDTMGDTFALHHAFTAGARSAIIVGGGYIGLEMAEAFTTRGLTVTLVEQGPAVMPGVQTGLRGTLRVERIDIPAGALFHQMTVDGLSDLDLSYTPSFGSPWDAIQLVAHDWARQARTPPA